MAAGDLLTADYQVEYGPASAGVFGQGHGGTEFVSIDLWQGINIRSSDINRPLDDGEFEGEDYLGGRDIILEFELWANTEAELATRWIEVLRLTRRRRNEQPLVARLPGWPDDLLVYCRPRRRTGLTVTLETALGYKGVGSVEFHATDPRVYGLTLQSKGGGVAVASGGLDFDISGNFVFGDTGLSGVLDCTNEGIFPTLPVFTIVGPITNPSIENQTIGKLLSFSGSVLDGETLVIDAMARTILLNGTSSRYSWLDDPTEWFTLHVGGNNIVLRGTTSGSPTITVEYRHAYA